MRSTLAVGLLLVTAMACTEAGCKSQSQDTAAPPERIATSVAALSSDSGTDAGPASPSIGSFALYATESILLNSGAQVTGCNVGVEGTSGPFLSGGVAAYFNSRATIQSSETLYANSVFLNSGASIGPVDTDSLGSHSGATYGTVSSFPAMPAAPTMPAATAGTQSITLNSGKSQTLTAGAYGSVVVNSNAKLTLSGGTYVFSSLTLNGTSTLSVSSPAVLSVTGSASFSGSSFFGPASGSGLTAKALVAYFNSSSNLNLNSGAQIQALVVATNALVNVDTANFTGALAAAQVVMNSNAAITCQDSFGSLGGGTCSGGCDDGNPCTIDACASGTCTHTPEPNGTTCPTGSNLCDQSYTCQAGVCTGSNPVTCRAPSFLLTRETGARSCLVSSRKNSERTPSVS